MCNPGDAAARAQQVERGCQILPLVRQGVDGSALGVEGLVEPRIHSGEVGDDARLVAVDDLEGLDLQQETGEEVPNAVVDLAGDPRSLGQGGGTRLVVLRLEQPGVRVLQGEDLLAQVVPRGVQGRPRGLLLVGAQREEGRERADDDEVEHRLFRRPPGHGHEERRAADRRDGPLPPGPECGEAGQVVDGQRRPGHGGRRESPEQEAGTSGPRPLRGTMHKRHEAPAENVRS